MRETGTVANKSKAGGQPGISEYILELGSKKREVRAKATRELLARGRENIPALVDALSNPDENIRQGAGRILDQINVNWSSHADNGTISSLVSDLGSKDGFVRVRARQALVMIGKKAVAPLEDALSSKDAWKRWEAAKALGQIGDPEATNILINALEDDVFDVRWLASEALITIGRPALAPLMRRLSEKADSQWIREGAHHVLHGIVLEDLREALIPVRNALEDPEASLEVPFAAEKVLKILK
jgi:HEAT repeat protein